MDKLKPLGKKDIKALSSMILDQFGEAFDFSVYSLYINRHNKVFLISKNICQVDTSKLRINSLGLYFGEIRNNMIRLSIEGSQIIHATKNIIELDETQAEKWMSGQDIEIDSDLNSYVIIKNNNDILGCGKIANKKLLNYVPKARRLT